MFIEKNPHMSRLYPHKFVLFKSQMHIYLHIGLQMICSGFQTEEVADCWVSNEI